MRILRSARASLALLLGASLALVACGEDSAATPGGSSGGQGSGGAANGGSSAGQSTGGRVDGGGASGNGGAGGTGGGGSGTGGDGGTSGGGGGAPSGGAGGGGGSGGGGPTPITAAAAAAAMTCGFNVGNTFETNQHPRTPTSVNAMIDAYYEQGYRMLRIPVRWLDADWGEGLLADPSGVVNRAHPRLASLTSIIDHALDRGMYVVVDAHHEDWLFTNPWSDAQLTIFRSLWSDICSIFADQGYGLVFEVVNEPHGTLVSDAAAVRALNQTAYDVIRGCGGHNAERIIVIDGDDWGSPASLRITWPSVSDIPGGGNDRYLMGSIHYYSPTALTHASDAAGINTAWTAESIRTSLDKTVVWADGRLPIYVGELGVNWDQHAHQINDNVRGWYAAVASETRSRGWAFALWDDGGWFRVMDRTDQTFNGLQAAACGAD